MTIVPNLNVLENGGACECVGGKLVCHAFALEGSKETFHDRIVVTITHTAHAQLSVGCHQAVLVGGAGVLAALVGMVQQSRSRTASHQGHAQGGFHQVGIHLRGHGPTDYSAGKQIQNGGQIQPAFCRVDVGEIADPFLVGRQGRKVLVEPVGRWNHARLALSSHSICYLTAGLIRIPSK